MSRTSGSTVLQTVQGFYATLLYESQHAGYTGSEQSLLADQRLYYGRYLNPGLRNYFTETVIPHIADSVAFLMTGAIRPRILDLGCGLGMQSIILASMGASVVGVDIRGHAIALCTKRKAFYESHLGMKLDIEFVQRDFLTSRPTDFETAFDSVYSMAAFSNMRPLEHTSNLVSTLLKNDAKISLYEKNSDHPLHALRKSPEPSPASTIDVFAKAGFARRFLYGGCALPGSFWKSTRLNHALVLPANNLLRKSLPLSFNYVLGLQRGCDVSLVQEPLRPMAAAVRVDAACVLDASSLLQSSPWRRSWRAPTMA